MRIFSSKQPKWLLGLLNVRVCMDHWMFVYTLALLALICLMILIQMITAAIKAMPQRTKQLRHAWYSQCGADPVDMHWRPSNAHYKSEIPLQHSTFPLPSGSGKFVVSSPDQHPSFELWMIWKVVARRTDTKNTIPAILMIGFLTCICICMVL